MSFAAGLLHGGIVLAGLAGGTALIVELVLARDPILTARHQDAAAALVRKLIALSVPPRHHHVLVLAHPVPLHLHLFRSLLL
jgi:uncharacterized protein HemY